MTLEELARRLECRLEGNGAIVVTRVAGLDEAGPGDLTFLANAKYANRLATTRASAVLVDDHAADAPCAVLRTPHVYLAFARAVGLLTPPARPAPGISAHAAIDPTAELGPDVSIGPFVTIGAGARIGARTVLEPQVTIGPGVTLGEDSHLQANVVVREGVTLGARVLLQSGVVLGSDGFGFAQRADGSHEKIPQIGRVVIEDDVEIGANSAIDRPAVGETRIGSGTKIDNLVQVAHGVQIGRHVLLAAQVGIAGSTVLEDRVMMAGQSGVTGHVRLGKGAIVGAKSAVTKDVAAGEHVAGVPAGDVAAWRESAVLVRRLPELRESLVRLEARLAAVETRLREIIPHMIRKLIGRAFVLGASVIVLTSATGQDTIVRPPKFNYTMSTLPNGLQVVFLEDHSTPIVHAALWYHVGSKDEKTGRTGFAHLFEHLMFKGSRNVKPDAHPSWITSIGGQANAFTDEDATVYWQTVPAQFLPLVLWLEADRMASLEVTDDKFKNEREVVKEERRMRVENQPFGRLSEIIFDKAFTTHPYKHQTIGSLEDLEAATIADVQAFHDTYYVPNNATLVLVGDFETKLAQTLVDQYIGRVPRGKPVPRDIPKEPAQKATTQFTVTENWPLPAVVVSYHITYDGHPDAYPLHILAKILSDGDSSRIYRSLVYEKQLALAAFGEAKLIEHPNLFYAVAIVDRGRKPEDAIRELQAQVDAVKTGGVTPAELNRAKRQFARDYILGRDTIQQKALHLGHAVTIHNDIKTADGEFDLFQSVTVADVQRVARTYFTPESRMLLTILPKSGSGSGSGSEPLPPGFAWPGDRGGK